MFSHKGIVALYDHQILTADSQIRYSVAPGYSYKVYHRLPDYLHHNFGISPVYGHKQIHHQICHISNAYYSSNFDDAILVSFDEIDKKSVIARAILILSLLNSSN